MLSQALSVFDFLKIKYPAQKPIIVLYIAPMLVGAILAYFSLLLQSKEIILLTHSRFSDAFNFLAILPGFYIASLAAISAINKSAIDEIINKKSPPYLIKREPQRTETYQQPLTRRLFLSLLFAYLASTSLLVVLALIIIRFCLDVFTLPIYVVVFFHFLIFSMLAQITLLSLVGISYLGYKSLASN